MGEEKELWHLFYREGRVEGCAMTVWSGTRCGIAGICCRGGKTGKNEVVGLDSMQLGCLGV